MRNRPTRTRTDHRDRRVARTDGPGPITQRHWHHRRANTDHGRLRWGGRLCHGDWRGAAMVMAAAEWTVTQPCRSRPPRPGPARARRAAVAPPATSASLGPRLLSRAPSHCGHRLLHDESPSWSRVAETGVGLGREACERVSKSPRPDSRLRLGGPSARTP